MVGNKGALHTDSDLMLLSFFLFMFSYFIYTFMISSMPSILPFSPFYLQQRDLKVQCNIDQMDLRNIYRTFKLKVTVLLKSSWSFL